MQFHPKCKITCAQSTNRKSSKIKVHKSTQKAYKYTTSAQRVWQKVRIVYLLRNRGGGNPPRCNIFWQILHTFCLLFNLFWTFPLKSIGFLRFQLIVRWCFNDFSGCSAYFLDILQLLCRSSSGQKAGPQIFLCKLDVYRYFSGKCSSGPPSRQPQSHTEPPCVDCCLGRC